MWNYYLHNEKYLGYSIGLLSRAFKGEACLRYGQIVLVSVIYDDDTKRQLIEETVLTCYRNYIEEGTLLGGDERQISALLASWKYTFKNHHSANEQEIRALLFYPHSTDPTLAPEFITNEEIKYRTKNGIIIPYIEVEFDKSIFDGICIAPNPRLQDAPNINNTIEYEMLDEFLRRNRYQANRISISTVPARY